MDFWTKNIWNLNPTFNKYLKKEHLTFKMSHLPNNFEIKVKKIKLNVIILMINNQSIKTRT